MLNCQIKIVFKQVVHFLNHIVASIRFFLPLTRHKTKYLINKFQTKTQTEKTYNFKKQSIFYLNDVIYFLFNNFFLLNVTLLISNDTF